MLCQIASLGKASFATPVYPTSSQRTHFRSSLSSRPNLKGKYPLGKVDKSDYDRVRKEVKEGLEGLTFEDGNKIAKKIYFKEELYKGPHINQAPDLVMLSNHGFDLKGRVNSDLVFARTNLMGMHTQDDAFFFSSSGVQCRTIFDAKKIILKSL